jgi:hypothetical protein
VPALPGQLITIIAIALTKNVLLGPMVKSLTRALPPENGTGTSKGASGREHNLISSVILPE